MSSLPPPDPIARLLAIHAETRRRLQAWADAPSVSPALDAWLEGPAHRADQILEQRLFPALIESMAGSDATCIKGMTSGLAQTRAALDQRWHHTVRPALREAPDSTAPDACLTWIRDMQAWLARADTELLPMAARLLDDDALAALAADCSALDHT